MDLTQITTNSPLSGLEYLIALRDQETRQKLHSILQENPQMADQPLPDSIWQRMSSPINPILLATAISMSVTQNADYSNFLQEYVNGFEICNLEERLIRIPDLKDEETLKNVLELEAQYVEAIIGLGKRVLLDYVRINGTRLIPIGDFPTLWDVYWGGWLAVNPFMCRLYQTRSRPDAFRGEYGRAMDYGNSINNQIHNAIGFYHNNLNKINKEMNELLIQQKSVTNQGNTVLVDIARKQSNATLLLERSQRLYYWAPHEINAHQMEIALTPSEKMSNPEFQARYARYMLPKDMEKEMLISLLEYKIRQEKQIT